MSTSRVRFRIGQLVHHKLFDYRGIIFDVDAAFQGSDKWYETMARTQPPRDKPWYGSVRLNRLEAAAGCS